MKAIKNKKILSLLNKQESMIQTRDEIIEIMKKEAVSLAEENKRLLQKVLELQQKKII